MNSPTEGGPDGPSELPLIPGEHPTLFAVPPRRGLPDDFTPGGGIGGHTNPNNGSTDTWLTPRWVIDAFGPFDLDPCAAPDPRPWDTAVRHITLPDDGLSASWVTDDNPKPMVWLNPPYGTATASWMRRLAAHGNGIALTFARTETDIFTSWVWPYATGVLFIRGRLHFCHPDGTRASNNSGGPSVLIAYGDEAAVRLAGRPDIGQWLPVPRPCPTANPQVR